MCNGTIKIYNWFGNKRFFPADKAEKQAVRKELGISKDSFVIISVGGCSVNKRHHDIIKALPDLLKEKNNLMYLHLGQGDTTEEEKLWQENLELRTKFVLWEIKKR